MAGARRSFEVVATSAAPPAAVFALLEDGAGWSTWAGRLVPASRWERAGDPPPGGPGAIRVLGRAPVFTREEIVESVPPSRHAYRILSGAPVRDHLATVDLTPTDDGGTRIVWTGAFAPRYPGTGGLVAAGMKAIIRQLAAKVAAAAAVGVPS